MLHRDSRLLVVSKPAFLRMSGDFVDTVAHRLQTEHGLDSDTLKPVHQLDYATSGVLVTALSKQAAAACTSLFQERLSKKGYVAIVELDRRAKGEVCPVSLDPNSRPV